MTTINPAHKAVFANFTPVVTFQFKKEDHEDACVKNYEVDACKQIDILLAEVKDNFTLYISASVNCMWLFEGDIMVLKLDDYAWDEGGYEYKGTLVVNAYANGFSKYLWN